MVTMPTASDQPDYAQLPSITALLDAAQRDERFHSYSKTQITNACRRAVDEGRNAIAGGSAKSVDDPIAHYLSAAHASNTASRGALISRDTRTVNSSE